MKRQTDTQGAMQRTETMAVSIASAWVSFHLDYANCVSWLPTKTYSLSSVSAACTC